MNTPLTLDERRAIKKQMDWAAEEIGRYTVDHPINTMGLIALKRGSGKVFESFEAEARADGRISESEKLHMVWVDKENTVIHAFVCLKSEQG